MIYLLMGELNLINKEKDEIIKKSNISSNSIINYDLEQDDIKDAINDLNTYNLFLDKKLVIVNNVSLIKDQEILIKYINNKTDNILILIEEGALDSRTKLYKCLKDNAKVLELTKVDLSSYVRNSFSEYKIDNSTIRLLLSYTNNNYDRLNNEIDKLKMYKFDTKEINSDDIKLVVKKDLDTNVFNLIEYIDQKNKDKAIKLYHDLIKSGEDEIKLIGLLASNYRLLYRVKTLMKDYNKFDIAKMLNAKIYPVEKQISKSPLYTFGDIEDILGKLSDLDIKIKSGKTDKRIGMENFLKSI